MYFSIVVYIRLLYCVHQNETLITILDLTDDFLICRVWSHIICFSDVKRSQFLFAFSPL